MTAPSESLEGTITFRRTTKNPCICVKDNEGQYKWVNLRNLSGADFETYREEFHEVYKLMKREGDNLEHKYTKLLNKQILYIPHPHERLLMERMFERLPIDFRQQLLIEFKHTIIGKSWCHLCMKLAYTKQRCLHFECPGMCDKCYMTLGDTCPACHRNQEIDCPICREPKRQKDLHTLSSCHHSICLKCFAMASLAGKPLLKCPVCRTNF